ncbi:tyrosine--tRNA ligase [Candidatus Vidania fulgoroideorum]
MIYKFGIDPNGFMHLGHFYIIKKIEKLMSSRDILYILIGDYTCRIGDPSYRFKKRNSLLKIKSHIKDIKNNITNIFRKRFVFIKNSKWFLKIKAYKIFELFNSFNFKYLINRREILKRISINNVKFIEVLYPIFQAYDNVKLKPDLEFGGNDQELNFIISNKIQKIIKGKLTKFVKLDLIRGINSNKKMSKSFPSNCIFLRDRLKVLFWKIMKIKDKNVFYYIKTFLFLHPKVKFKEKKNFFIDRKVFLFYIIAIKINNNIKSVKKVILSFLNKDKEIISIVISKPNRIVYIISKSLSLSVKHVKILISQKAIKLNNILIKNSNFLLKENSKISVGKRYLINVLYEN